MIGCQGKIETVIGCRWLMFEVLEAVMVYCSELWHVLSAHPDSPHLITVDVPPEAENIPRVQQSESTYKINCCFVYTIFVMCHVVRVMVYITSKLSSLTVGETTSIK